MTLHRTDPRRWLAAILCLSLGNSAAIGQGPAAPASPPPERAARNGVAANPAAAAQTHYFGREIARTMHYTGADWLIRDSRQREEDCEAMLRALDLQPGMQVCDMGCGNGFYALQIAEAVGPNGIVYAVDIQPEMLRLLQARAAESQVENIRPILGTVVDPKLPDQSCDLILLVDVYHEFSHPEQMLAAVRRALRPDGVAVLVEFREEDHEVPILPLHKMSKRQIMREWSPNGFRLEREFDELPWQHMMYFRRAELPADGSAGRPSRE